MKKFFAAAIISSVILSGCARNMNSSNYVSSDTAGKMVEGTIVSAGPVHIKDADKLQDNSAGMLAGGAGGLAAGSGIGKGSGKATAEVGGAIAGAIIGAVIEDQLSQSDGMEYIIKVKGDNQSSEKQKVSKIKHVKGETVNDEVKDSIKTNMKTNLVSVVQGKDEIFKKGHSTCM